MARRLRVSVGGEVYHVLNRRVGKRRMFADEGDYLAFEKVLAQAADRYPTRVLAYCLMPNHWHLVLRPEGDGELSEYMRWVSVTHTQRWHAHRGSSGSGPLYQGRFKSFPVQDDDHFLTVCRYVERNPLRAKLVEKADGWAYCSLRRRRTPKTAGWLTPLADWPVAPPRDWIGFVSQPQSNQELAVVRESVSRGRPFGRAEWQIIAARRLRLQSSLNPMHRPAKDVDLDNKDS